VNMRFVGLWHVCRGELGNRKAVPCDFVCEGIFASAVLEEIYGNFSTIIFFKRLILNH
jgi:hypothetical protein